MTRLIKYCIWSFAVSCSIAGHAQKTPEDLGIVTFQFFQENKLDSFFRLIPTINELMNFGASAGVDTNSADYKELVQHYPSLIDHFRQTCASIENNDEELHFSWRNSSLDSLGISGKSVPIDNRNPNSKTVVITIIDIYFTSNSQALKLTLGDANKYGDIWKPGNRIALSKQ